MKERGPGVSKFPVDLERMSDELDAVFDAHGVNLSMRVAWAVALLGASHSSSNWEQAWVQMPEGMAWMRQIAHMCELMLNPMLDPREENHEN